MSVAFFSFFRNGIPGEKPLHPVERQAAKHYVKSRLVHLYPELAHDPAALERAYQELDLKPLPGCGEGGETLFEISTH